MRNRRPSSLRPYLRSVLTEASCAMGASHGLNPVEHVLTGNIAPMNKYRCFLKSARLRVIIDLVMPMTMSMSMMHTSPLDRCSVVDHPQIAVRAAYHHCAHKDKVADLQCKESQHDPSFHRRFRMTSGVATPGTRMARSFRSRLQ